jgi:hypothetical protein
MTNDITLMTCENEEFEEVFRQAHEIKNIFNVTLTDALLAMAIDEIRWIRADCRRMEVDDE